MRTVFVPPRFLLRVVLLHFFVLACELMNEPVVNERKRAPGVLSAM